MKKENPTVAIQIIGNEILSGKTQDINLNFIAKRITFYVLTLNIKGRFQLFDTIKGYFTL